VHLGAAYSHGDPEGDDISFSQRPEAHLAPRFVDTGDIPTDGLDRMGLEAAWGHGPFSLQGEYMRAWVDTSGATPSFDGYYVQASYFLTGEHRPYKTARGTFDRVRVNRPFLFGDGGPGAWEVATRYSAIDLSDEDVRGGRLSDVSGGVNWHLDDNVRVSANYVWANLHTVGDAHAFQTRFQIDF
jgi:phosphate-selective porin OprO/OprP